VAAGHRATVVAAVRVVEGQGAPRWPHHDQVPGRPERGRCTEEWISPLHDEVSLRESHKHRPGYC
jgi:hypothetical protein